MPPHHPDVTFGRCSWCVLTCLVLVATGLRMFFVLSFADRAVIDADEAVVGLMGKHFLQGELRAFYWGQDYMGTLEPATAGLLFALLGTTPLVLKLAPLAYLLATLLIHFTLLHRLGGLAAATVGGLLCAVPGQFFLIWSLKARGGYIEVLAIGAALFLATHVVITGADQLPPRRRGALWALIGFLAGLGVWTNLMIGYYLLPIAIVLGLARRRWWSLSALLAAPAYLAGAAPIWIDKLLHGGRPPEIVASVASLHEFREHLSGLFTVGIPIVLGARINWSDHDADRWLSPYIYVLFACLCCFWIVHRAAHHLRRRPPRSRLPLDLNGWDLYLLLVLLAPLLFARTRSAFFIIEPRYVLPLCVALTVPAAYAVAVLRPYRWGPLLVAAALAPALVLYGRTHAGMTVRELTGATPHSMGPVVQRARRLDLEGVIAPYWLAYRFTFESGERPIAACCVAPRYDPYQTHLLQSDRWAVLTDAENRQPLQRALEWNGVESGPRGLVRCMMKEAWLDVPLGVTRLRVTVSTGAPDLNREPNELEFHLGEDLLARHVARDERPHTLDIKLPAPAEADTALRLRAGRAWNPSHFGRKEDRLQSFAVGPLRLHYARSKKGSG